MLHVVGLLALTGFVHPVGGATARAAQLRIGAHRTLAGAFDVVALRQGYWEAEGLDYTFRYFKQGKLMRNAVMQDNLDTGSIGLAPFVTAISKGARIVAVGITADTCANIHLVVSADSSATSPTDLVGTVLANTKGTQTDLSWQAYVLPRHGLKPSDVQVLSVPSTQRIAAIVSGVAQAGVVLDPQAEVAVQKGLVRSLGSLCAYSDNVMIQIGNPRTLQTHPELYEKYFRGWIRAHQLLREDSEQFARVYAAALQEVGDKAETQVVLPVVKRLKSELLITDEMQSRFNAIAAIQVRLGWIQNHPDLTTHESLDDSILRRMVAEMGWNSPD